MAVYHQFIDLAKKFWISFNDRMTFCELNGDKARVEIKPILKIKIDSISSFENEFEYRPNKFQGCLLFIILC